MAEFTEGERRLMEDLEFDLGDFVKDLVEEWEVEQLMEYAEENLMEFYGKHPDIAVKDFKLFVEDHKAHHVLGY